MQSASGNSGDSAASGCARGPATAASAEPDRADRRRDARARLLSIAGHRCAGHAEHVGVRPQHEQTAVGAVHDDRAVAPSTDTRSMRPSARRRRSSASCRRTRPRSARPSRPASRRGCAGPRCSWPDRRSRRGCRGCDRSALVVAPYGRERSAARRGRATSNMYVRVLWPLRCSSSSSDSTSTCGPRSASRCGCTRRPCRCVVESTLAARSCRSRRRR